MPTHDGTDREGLLAALAEFAAEELEFALLAAASLRRVKTGDMYLLHHLLGFQVEEVVPGEKAESLVSLPLSRMSDNLIGMAHGGVIATLCDNAMAIAGAARLGNMGVTLSLQVTFHKAARGENLHARAHVLHGTRQFNSTRCEVTDDEDGLVASATGIFYHRPARGVGQEATHPAPDG